MAVVTIDGQEIEIGDDERINGIQAAQRLGVAIPHYCWHPGLSVVASCRMCLVETGSKDAESGEIKMVPKLVPACQTLAKDGTVFVTNSEKVKHARAMVEEDLLMDHPIDCPICDKAGECSLQDYHFKHGTKQRRADIKPFHSSRRDMGDTVTLFVERCVMCSRCVRFTREVSGTAELMVINRGAKEEIDVFPGFPLENKLSGNVVDLCPVGALGDKDFLYKQRVWYMKKHQGVCTGCSTGCSIWIDENQDQVYRLRPRENAQVNTYWMCDEGRYGFHYIHDEQRIVGPWKKSNDQWMAADWVQLFDELRTKLSQAKRLGAIISPHASIEEAFALCQLIRELDGDAILAVGPLPTVGEDETFKDGFTIRAEKCPNHRGVEKVVQHFGGCNTFDDFVNHSDRTSLRGVWFAGGYQPGILCNKVAEPFADLDLLVVQDLFASPITEMANYVLPATSFAEKPGSYVNHADHLQSVDWAIRVPAGIRQEGAVYRQIQGLKGMYKAKDVRTTIAQEIVYFSAAAGEVPETGINLKVNQLAST